MKSKSISLRKICSLTLSCILLVALVFGAFNTMAANYTDRTLYMNPDSSEPISVPNGTITEITSSNTSIVSVSSSSGTSASIYSVREGNAYIYVTARNTSGTYDYYTIPVSVSSDSGYSNSSVNIYVNRSYVIGMFDEVSGINSSNYSVANATVSNGVITVFGVSPGTAIISYKYRNNNGNLVSSTVTVYVTSVATPTPTTSTYTSQTSMKLEAGKKYVTSETYYSVENISVDNPSICTATFDSLGRVSITAISAGTTTIRYSFKATASGILHTNVIPVEVSGTSFNTPTPTNSSSITGIAFKSYNVSVVLNKSYRIGTIYLNGNTVSADSLLWMSNNLNVITVNRSTGVFKCVGTGTAKLIAVDKDARYMNSITITVKAP